MQQKNCSDSVTSVPHLYFPSPFTFSPISLPSSLSPSLPLSLPPPPSFSFLLPLSHFLLPFPLPLSHSPLLFPPEYLRSSPGEVAVELSDWMLRFSGSSSDTLSSEEAGDFPDGLERSSAWQPGLNKQKDKNK